MDSKNSFLRLFRSTDVSTTNETTNRESSNDSRTPGIFRSDSSAAIYQSLQSWNRSSANPLFGRSASTSSRPGFGQWSVFSEPRPTLFNPNWSLTTPATVTSEAERSTVIMCVVEGRGRAKNTIGMAVIDLYNPRLLLSQFGDSANYESLLTRIVDSQPILILLPNTLVEECHHLVQTLAKHCKHSLPNTRIDPFDRKHFKEEEGIELVARLRCDDNPTLMIELREKYYCLAACAALIKYIEVREQLIYLPNSLRIDFEGCDNTMAIDPTTAKLLELIVNLDNPRSGQSLFGILDRTKTRAGYRLLRSNILQPSTDLKLIQTRLDMVEEIVSSEQLFNDLEAILSQFTAIEIDRIISTIIQVYKLETKSVKTAERKIETVIVLKHVLSLIEPMVKVLDDCENPNFKKLAQVLSDPRFNIIIEQINEVIVEDCKYAKSSLSMTLAKCHAIKREVNSLLDIARDTYSESIDDISHMVDAYASKFGLPMRTIHSIGKGYHIEIKGKHVDTNTRLPNIFIKVYHKRGSITCTTWDLINKNNRITASIEEIYLMSDAVVTALIANIRQYIGCLYDLSEVLAKTDLLFSLASQCAAGQYIRPEFGDYTAIKAGRHPLLEKVLSEPPVANDTFLSEDKNFHIVTGPNMSGKSTLLRQVALLQVMAQIGSFIPAEFAKFRICDKLFSRIGNNDEIETSSSTFMVEMREISFILHNITDRSLVIIDELGRGTSAEEGVGLCFSICEALLKSKAFTLFVTHFLELTNLANHFLNVDNYTFGLEKKDTETESDGLYGFTHALEPGVTKEPLYGIRLAKCTAMDPEIVVNAEKIAQQLRQVHNQPVFSGQMTERKKVLYRLATILTSLVKDGSFGNKPLLRALQTEYREKLAQTESETETPVSEESLLI